MQHVGAWQTCVLAFEEERSRNHAQGPTKDKGFQASVVSASLSVGGGDSACRLVGRYNAVEHCAVGKSTSSQMHRWRAHPDLSAKHALVACRAFEARSSFVTLNRIYLWTSRYSNYCCHNRSMLQIMYIYLALLHLIVACCVK